ncbi:hypothetical protein WA026_006461 [Henosepilachna vigintioctopunctata]|uniref:SUN domain-containing protein n=1 Tax=Henosepilachna vigintioctopunctata TaxID=420089 RepID=A0AAW1UGR9_9CUCU
MINVGIILNSVPLYFSVTTGGTPLVVTLPEDASSELKAKVEELSASIAAGQLESHLNQTKDTAQPLGDAGTPDADSDKLVDLKNDTDLSQNATGDAQEDIPSFSEWAQKRMEEAEKNGEVQNDSTHHQATSNGKSGSGVKLGWKNYAAPDCGAKVVAANPEAISPKSVISPSREEYKLNVCTDRIWFIVELCEAIQAKKIDIANFELFSSTPKDFVVSIGDRFPSKEWSTVGQFTTQDVRDIQSFDLSPHLFGRYIKVEVKSHHGSQHYCPISLFRVYGTSELEVLQKEEADEDDDDDDNETLDAFTDDKPKNMLNSATNAVFSMIKKAAEVLVTKSNDTVLKNDDKIKKTEYTPLINTCSTPSHRIVCVNCSDVLFGQIYELISCKSVQLHNLIGVPYIRRSLIHSNICHEFGLKFNENAHHSTFNRSSRSVGSFFSNKILGAMCNVLSVSENKAVLNISLEFSNETDDSLQEIDENLDNIETSKVNLKVEHSMDHPVSESDEVIRPTEELNIVMTNHVNIPKSSCSTDVAYSSQIKPTKTVTLDVLVDSSNISNDSETEELPVQGSKTDLPVIDSEIENDNERAAQVESKINDTHQSAEINTVGEISTESSENIDQMENFMVDVNVENGPSTVPSVSASSSNERQKESVFLRLSNRIKVLERNVSLSSQYLEELSRRYKKQVEEMQKLLDKTLQSVVEERKRMDEKNQQLEERVDQLMTMISKWPTVLFWVFLTVAFSCGMLWLCRSDGTPNTVISSENIERRNSVDIIRTGTKKTKIRRPSDQALKIVRSSLLHEERKLSKEKRKRKKSNKGMKRSNSVTGLESDISKTKALENSQLSSSKQLSSRSTPERSENSHPGDQPYVPNNSDWVEENQRVLEVTLLDESEHSSLEPISALMEHVVPQYTKTATDVRAHRMSSQYNNPNVNGDTAFRADVTRKTVSLDESYSANHSINRRSSLNSKSEEGARKKGKKSFRSVLKNVFT